MQQLLQEMTDIFCGGTAPGASALVFGALARKLVNFMHLSSAGRRLYLLSTFYRKSRLPIEAHAYALHVRWEEFIYPYIAEYL